MAMEGRAEYWQGCVPSIETFLPSAGVFGQHPWGIAWSHGEYQPTVSSTSAGRGALAAKHLEALILLRLRGPRKDRSACRRSILRHKKGNVMYDSRNESGGETSMRGRCQTDHFGCTMIGQRSGSESPTLNYYNINEILET